MLNQRNIVSEIDRFNSDFFKHCRFEQYRNNYNKVTYVLSSSNPSNAINNYNENKEIKVCPFIDQYWVYIVLIFIQKNKKEQDFLFSLSLFEGEENDNVKTQLFRAEWDNYSDGNMHPQPHWHFYFQNNFENSPNSFDEIITNESDFENSLNSESYIDNFHKIRNFHFAMSSNYDKHFIDSNEVKDEKHFIEWYKWLLINIKRQLEYIK